MSHSWVRALSVRKRQYGLVGLLHGSTSLHNRVTDPIPYFYEERHHLHSIAHSDHVIKIISGKSSNLVSFVWPLTTTKVVNSMVGHDFVDFQDHYLVRPLSMVIEGNLQFGIAAGQSWACICLVQFRLPGDFALWLKVNCWILSRAMMQVVIWKSHMLILNLIVVMLLKRKLKVCMRNQWTSLKLTLICFQL